MAEDSDIVLDFEGDPKDFVAPLYIEGKNGNIINLGGWATEEAVFNLPDGVLSLLMSAYFSALGAKGCAKFGGSQSAADGSFINWLKHKIASFPEGLPSVAKHDVDRIKATILARRR